MKTGIKIFFVISILFSSIVISNAANTCSQESDEYVLKCTIPEKYFSQDFTCLNKDCSLRLKNKYGSFLEFYEGNKLITIILRNNIELNDINQNLKILNAICEEKFSNEELNKLQSELNDYFEYNWRYFSGEKLVVETYSKKKEDSLLQKQKESKKSLEQCYEVKYEKVGNWLISSKQKKPYCDLTYQNENECFTTQVSYSKFATFLIFNPSEATLLYVLYIAIAITILYMLTRLVKDYRKIKKLKKFIKIDKNKIIITAILIVPFTYIYGMIIKYFVNRNYYAPFLDPTLGLLLTILGVLVIYLIASIIDHHHKKYKKRKKN